MYLLYSSTSLSSVANTNGKKENQKSLYSTIFYPLTKIVSFRVKLEVLAILRTWADSEK